MTMIHVDISSKTHLKNNQQSAFPVLCDIQFDVRHGEFCCIVGPSGCGKTTLLNLISGLDQNFEGSVAIDGGAPSAGPTPGYMFQSSRLMPWLTVREKVELGQRTPRKPATPPASGCEAPLPKRFPQEHTDPRGSSRESSGFR